MTTMTPRETFEQADAAINQIIEDAATYALEHVVRPVCDATGLSFLSGNGEFYFLDADGVRIDDWDAPADLAEVLAVLSTYVGRFQIGEHIGTYNPKHTEP